MIKNKIHINRKKWNKWKKRRIGEKKVI